MENLDTVMKLHVKEGRYAEETKKRFDMHLRLLSFGLLVLLLATIISVNLGAQLQIIDSKTYPETFLK